MHAWPLRHAAGCAASQQFRYGCDGSTEPAQPRWQPQRCQHAARRREGCQRHHQSHRSASCARRPRSSHACAAQLASSDGVTANAAASEAGALPLGRVCIRAAQLEDAEAIAALCGQSFAGDAVADVGRLPPSPSKDLLLELEAAYGRQIAATLLTELRAALTTKLQVGTHISSRLSQAASMQFTILPCSLDLCTICWNWKPRMDGRVRRRCSQSSAPR